MMPSPFEGEGGERSEPGEGFFFETPRPLTPRLRRNPLPQGERVRRSAAPASFQISSVARLARSRTTLTGANSGYSSGRLARFTHTHLKPKAVAPITSHRFDETKATSAGAIPSASE